MIFDRTADHAIISGSDTSARFFQNNLYYTESGGCIGDTPQGWTPEAQAEKARRIEEERERLEENLRQLNAMKEEEAARLAAEEEAAKKSGQKK